MDSQEVTKPVSEHQEISGDNDENDRPCLDAEHSTNYFPPEIWDMICDKLKDARDYVNLSLASDYLERVLLPTKYYWSFGQIFPILHQSLYVKAEDIKTCRQVCKLWRNSTDDYIQKLRFQDSLQSCKDSKKNLSYEHINQWDSYFSKWFRYSDDAFSYRFKTIDDISRFEGEMNCHVGNPFATRSANFHSDEEYEPLYWKRSVQSLKKFGKHLWFLQLWFQGPQLHLITVPKILRDCLVQVPNLRGLCVYICEDLNKDEPKKPLRTDLLTWKRSLQCGAFPQLPNLEVLEIQGETSGISHLQTAATKFPSCYYRSLRKFESNNVVINRIFPKGTENKLPNLTSIDTAVESLSDLHNLGKLNSPLKRIVIYTEASAMYEISLADFFTTFRKFAGTLSTLKISGICFGLPWRNFSGDASPIAFHRLRVIRIEPFYEASLDDIRLIGRSLPPCFLKVNVQSYVANGVAQDEFKASIRNILPSVRKLQCHFNNDEDDVEAVVIYRGRKW